VPHPPEYERLLDLLRGEFRSRDERLAGVEAALAQHTTIDELREAIRQALGLLGNLQSPISEMR